MLLLYFFLFSCKHGKDDLGLFPIDRDTLIEIHIMCFLLLALVIAIIVITVLIIIGNHKQ